MTEGVVRTKGTRLYFAYSATEILKVDCATGITGLGGAGTQIDKTCLDSEESEYERGMKDPGEITVPINFIPQSAAHQALMDLDDSGNLISWMVVLSDQPAAPTSLDSDGRLVSPGPTTVEFMGYVANVELNINGANEIVRGTLTIQRSGPRNWTWPASV